MATGRIAAPDRTASVVKPGRNGAISPSYVRVPSGKINTISPRFSRFSDSLIPPSPMPSRSIGMASTEWSSQAKSRKRKSVLRAR